MPQEKTKSFSAQIALVKNLRPFDKFLFFLFLIIISTFTLIKLNQINEKISVLRPIAGGEIKEGFIGIPFTLNPLYAKNNPEKDLKYLLHASLVRHNTKNEYVNYIAEDIKINDDYTEFLITLKKDVHFHNGFLLDSDDVIETIKLIQNKKNTQYSFDNIKITKIDKNGLKVNTKTSDYNFIKKLTFPILPYKIWRKIPDESFEQYSGAGAFIGLGPYYLEKELKDIDEKSIQITLLSNKKYVYEKPYINKINFFFYKNGKELYNALSAGKINSINNISPHNLTLIKNTLNFKNTTSNSNKIFGIFFNTRDELIFSNTFLRSVASKNISREKIIKNALLGYGRPVENPYPFDNSKNDNLNISKEDLAQTLNDIGWTVDLKTGIRNKNNREFQIRLAIPNIEELKKVASIISKTWAELNISVKTTYIEPNDFLEFLNGSDYDVAIYAYSAANYEDLDSIWNSKHDKSIAALLNYGNIILNKDLEIIQNTPPNNQKIVYNEIKSKINKEVPSLFLYSPYSIYLTKLNIKGNITEKNLFEESDRFFNIHNWYIEEEKIWKFLNT